jgi:hypothetical protein
MNKKIEVCKECQFESGEHSQSCSKYKDEFSGIDEIIKEKQEKKNWKQEIRYLVSHKLPNEVIGKIEWLLSEAEKRGFTKGYLHQQKETQQIIKDAKKEVIKELEKYFKNGKMWSKKKLLAHLKTLKVGKDK